MGGNNDAQALCYTDSGLTNSLTLTNLLYYIGLTLDHTLKGDTLIVCGVNPFGGPGSVFEYQLGDQSPLPTTISLTTNFYIGPGTTYAGSALLSNGGVACMLTQSSPYTNQAFAVSYRRPSGSWTNYGVVVVETNNFVLSAGFPTTFALAEMPGDNTLWTFQTRDSAGWLLAGVWSFTSTDLSVKNGFMVADNDYLNDFLIWGYQAPYGEYPSVECVSDPATNRILVGYFSHLGFTGAPDVRVGTEVVIGITADTNHYVACLSTNTTHRDYSCSFYASPAGVWFGYPFCTLTNAEPLDNQPLPFMLQSIPSGSPISPFLDWAGTTGVGGVLYRQDAFDFMVKPNSNSVWQIVRLAEQL